MQCGFLHSLSYYLPCLYLYQLISNISHNVIAIKPREHSQTVIVSFLHYLSKKKGEKKVGKKRKKSLSYYSKHNMFYGCIAVWITEAAVSVEICISASSAMDFSQ